MANITGVSEAILSIRLALPPGTTPEKAIGMLSQGGVNLPLGLVNFVRQIHVEIVDVGQPGSPIPPPEDGGGSFKLVT